METANAADLFVVAGTVLWTSREIQEIPMWVWLFVDTVVGDTPRVRFEPTFELVSGEFPNQVKWRFRSLMADQYKIGITIRRVWKSL